LVNTQNNDDCDIALMINSVQHTFVRPDGLEERGALSFASVVQCNLGDEIWLERYGEEGTSTADVRARFSGFKLG
jgi:hypothetical protein